MDYAREGYSKRNAQNRRADAAAASVEVSSEQVEMKGYPRILLKTKADELYGLGYPAILLKADVIENIHGRDAFTTSGEFAGNHHQGAREQARQMEPAEKKVKTIEQSY